MTDRPILFSAPMVRALLDGRKTQTRRVLKPQPFFNEDGVPRGDVARGWVDDLQQPLKVSHAVGDRLWVREGFQYIEGPPEKRQPNRALFAADMRDTDGKQWSAPSADVKWRPSIHMPRWASRLTLTVTDVRVQRVRDISNDDAKAEGIKRDDVGYYDYRTKSWGFAGTDAPMISFRTLWDSLNKARGFGWDANPWVVAYAFTVEKRNIDQ